MNVKLGSSILLGWLLLTHGMNSLHGQVPDVELPPPVTPSYVRPDLSVTAWDLSGVTLNEQQQDGLTHVLVEIVRDYSTSKLVTPVWKSRLLGIALRLQPDNRDAIIANGQLARGVEPQCLHAAPPPLDKMALSLLRYSTTLMGAATDKHSPNYVLGYHLLDVAVHLDLSNAKVWEAVQQDAPALKWDALLSNIPTDKSLLAEETPDLKRTNASLSLLLMTDTKGTGKPELKTLQAKATKHPGALALALPKEIDKPTAAAVPQVRSLLRARHESWPGGWRVELPSFGVPVSAQPGVYLGMAALLDSLISGAGFDPHTLLACGMDPRTGKALRTVTLTTVMTTPELFPANTWVVLADVDFGEIQDLLLVNADRWQDLLRTRLFVAQNLSECISLATMPKAAALTQNLADAQSLIEQAKQGGILWLRSEPAQRAISEVLLKNPGNLSLQILDTIAQKRLPKEVSKAGSLNLLGRLGAPVTRAGSKLFPIKTLWTDKLNLSPWAKARQQIERLRPSLPLDARPYADALVDVAKLYDALVTAPPQVPAQRQEVERHIKEARSRLHKAYGELKAKIPPQHEITADEPPEPTSALPEEEDAIQQPADDT